jgi:pre-mRNA-processing factor 40
MTSTCVSPLPSFPPSLSGATDLSTHPQALLNELVTTGEISAGTTWKSIYPLIAHDERYLSVLGTSGSSPLELFWDLVDELDVRAEEDQHVVELVAREKGLTVGEKTEEEEFVKVLEGDERLAKMDPGAIRATFDRVRGAVCVFLLF